MEMDNGIIDSSSKESEFATSPLIKLCDLETTTLPRFVSENGCASHKSSIQDDELAIFTPILTPELPNSLPDSPRQVSENLNKVLDIGLKDR